MSVPCTLTLKCWQLVLYWWMVTYCLNAGLEKVGSRGCPYFYWKFWGRMTESELRSRHARASCWERVLTCNISIRAGLEWLYFLFWSCYLPTCPVYSGCFIEDRSVWTHCFCSLASLVSKQLLASAPYLEFAVQFVHNSTLSVISCAARFDFKAVLTLASSQVLCQNARKRNRLDVTCFVCPTTFKGRALAPT